MILIKNNGTFKHVSKEECENIYYDYVNNYLTLSCMAEDYGVSYYSLETIIKTIQISSIKKEKNYIESMKG